MINTVTYFQYQLITLKHMFCWGWGEESDMGEARKISKNTWGISF